MAIPDEDVARVRAATDIVALVSEHAPLKRVGRRWVGLCPFHQEKSPSFSVNAEDGFYYCFGCQRSGDAITFVREVEHLDFVDAVRRLADRASITITEDGAAAAARMRRAPLTEALEAAVEWYHERLLSAPDAGAARDYLRSRGYDGEVVRRFKLGWAPDGWDTLSRALKLSSQVLSDSGLGFVNRAGRRQDAFRARVLFPVMDPSGHPIAFGGRILPARGGTDRPAGDGGAKYKNSAEGPLYSKSKTLYALNWAKHDVIASGEVIVCEGYTDVIGCFLAGLPRAVATCGTALGEEHFRLLSNFAKRIVLAYDADAAGRSGASRVYEWERHHQVDVAVAALPPGSDPGELARRDPEALRHAIATAQPFLGFHVEQVLAAGDLTTAEGRARVAEGALAVVREHPNPLVRDQYVMLIADRCRLEVATLRPLATPGASGDAGVRGGPPRAAAPGGAGSTGGVPRQPPRRDHFADRSPVQGPDGRAERAGQGAGERPGLEALRLAVHQPELVAHRLEVQLFADDLQRRAFVRLLEAQSLQQAIDAAEHDDPAVAQLLRRLVVEEPATEGDVGLATLADDVIFQLVRSAVRRALGTLQGDARREPDSLARHAQVSAQVLRDVELLDAPAAAAEAAGRLLAWLAGAAEEA